MTPDQFRQLALAIPQAVESAHMNHPDFRLDDKIFASLGKPDDDWGMVKLTPEEQRTFIKGSPKAFQPCAGAWGERGYTNVHLPSITTETLRSALTAAAANVTRATTKKKPKKSVQ
jgi:hypothetical protein